MKEEEAKKKTSPLASFLTGLLVVALSLAVVTGVAWYMVFQVNEFSLTLEMAGEPDIYLQYGEDYEDAGAQAMLFSSLFWEGGYVLEEKYLTVTTDHDPQALGKFTVTYEARVLDMTAQAQRSILVVDTQPPVITLTEPTGYMVLPGNIFDEPGFTAIDNFDGDITHRVIRKSEDELVTYAVTDSSGNPASAKRVVPGYDPNPPVITLVGGDRLSLPPGTPYQEPGYTAMDSLGNDLTALVTVEGEVDWSTPGIYPVVYSVMDEMQNKTTVARKVIVREEILPEAENWPALFP